MTMQQEAGMTEQELERLEALAAAATPGPWKSGHHASDECVVRKHTGDVLIHDEGTHSAADAAFIAAARDAVPALVAEVRRLRHELTGIAIMPERSTDGFAYPAREVADAMRKAANRALGGAP